MATAKAKPRAIKVFSVSYKGIRLRVRVLPHAKDVYREFNGPDSRWLMRNDLPEGFFNPFEAHNSKYVGEVVLAGNADLTETVPHEVFHAVVYFYKTVGCIDDEPAAYAMGKLTSRILAKIGGTITLEGE